MQSTKKSLRKQTATLQNEFCNHERKAHNSAKIDHCTMFKQCSVQIPAKIYLSENELPTHFQNLKAYMPETPAPMLNPSTKQPVTAAELSSFFCKELAEQELNTKECFIPIPAEVKEFFRKFRPSPLVRAYDLERELGTKAEIYYKFEGNNTSGSHKLNSAIVQAYYAKKEGLTALTTETGAGQWGTALSMACSHFGLKLNVFMVKSSGLQKTQRKALIETYGAGVLLSPSQTTQAGRAILKENPDHTGSLGTAISEALEVASQTDKCKYVLGSVLDHVLLHQSIIGLETKTALEKYGIRPDVIIGCAGGGSNLGGLITPFMADKLQGKNNIKFVAAEPASCPSLTRGKYVYDFGDAGETTPLMKMYSLGCHFLPSVSHAGGLRYHGMSPILSKLYHDGFLEAKAYGQKDIMDAAVFFAKTEGILPAPESAHAILCAMNEAKNCKEKKVIVFGLTGTGYFDMAAYERHREGVLENLSPTDEELAKNFTVFQL